MEVSIRGWQWPGSAWYCSCASAAACSSITAVPSVARHAHGWPGRFSAHRASRRPRRTRARGHRTSPSRYQRQSSSWRRRGRGSRAWQTAKMATPPPVHPRCLRGRAVAAAATLAKCWKGWLLSRIRPHLSKSSSLRARQFCASEHLCKPGGLKSGLKKPMNLKQMYRRGPSRSSSGGNRSLGSIHINSLASGRNRRSSGLIHMTIAIDDHFSCSNLTRDQGQRAV